ncbi:MAG: polyprenyl synthetase family protein [Lachnospiraceae bacterium]|jgi:geranylgeranyl diphosphate synthase type II|nr:polyprenyl synthetase family protein [Lachnospiraceae bacterium]MBQ3912319.1 polyprenyl synthetase family protein [Lachnospiraceae bacterium]MCR5427713.1 polyprenyl synthetase family protein [Lachnospiraceae bacterium]
MIDLNAKASQINNILQDYLPEETKEFGDITEAMSYSVLAGGKRLRAIMLIESFRLFNNDSDMEKMLVHPFAAAVEFIHAYSLVHDDLPSMDNDMYRRGILTTHAKYGHAMGVLTGDALLNYAFETVTATLKSLEKLRGEVVPELYARVSNAAHILFTKAGYSGMIGGQVLDVYFPNDPNADKGLLKLRLLKMYELKTSNLFRAALCAGAALAGASEADIKKLDSFGYNLGLAFQIDDDILDETATFEQLGKDIGSDKKNNKLTICTLLGIDAAKDLSREKLELAGTTLESLPGNKEFFNDLIEYLSGRKK